MLFQFPGVLIKSLLHNTEHEQFVAWSCLLLDDLEYSVERNMVGYILYFVA